MKINSLVSVTVSALNQNINQDLDLGPVHNLKADIIQGSSTNRVLLLKAAIVGSYDTAGMLTLSGADLSAGAGARIYLFGNNSGSGNDGQIQFKTPNAAKSGNVLAAKIEGNLDTPWIHWYGNHDFHAYRIKDLDTNLGGVNAAGDAVPYIPWRDWTPTGLGWNAGTPSGNVTSAGRYVQIGKTVYFWFEFHADNSNGANAVYFSTPPLATTKRTPILGGVERYGVALALSIDPQFYMDASGIIYCANFKAGTAGQPIEISFSGFYEVG